MRVRSKTMAKGGPWSLIRASVWDTRPGEVGRTVAPRDMGGRAMNRQGMTRRRVVLTSPS